MKHALLVWLVRALLRKPAGFAVLDTHAGSGRYDLASAAAARSGEATGGILRLLAARPPALADYLGLVEQLGLYPGSPLLVRALLRPQDRLICCEWHAEEATALRRCFWHDRQVAVHHRDGREAVRGLLPPLERRGLVLIDPPYEAIDEYAALAESLSTAHHRFGAGVLAGWYPIKHLTPVNMLHQALQASGVRDIVAAELLLRPATDPTRLNGCGLVVIQPPFGFVAAANGILAALQECLADSDGGNRVLTLVAE